jgi:DNA sulfur modification protein DndE
MITRIKISRSSTGILTKRYKGLRQTLTPNIILRNALMFSIKNGDRYKNENLDTGGTEFQISTLLGSKSNLYKLIIDQYYNMKLKDEEYKKVLCYHIEEGIKNKSFLKIFN